MHHSIHVGYRVTVRNLSVPDVKKGDLSPADCFARCGDAQKFSSMNADHGKPDGDCISLPNNLVNFKTSVLKNLMTTTEICDVLRETRYAFQARRDVSGIIIMKQPSSAERSPVLNPVMH